MFKYSFYISIFFLNLMSLLINNWFMMWILMELNLMMFLPLIIEKNNIKMYSKISFKYFLIQSISSMFILISLLMNKSFNMIINQNIILLILMLSTFMKLGMFPIHMWFIKIMNMLNWFNCFLLSTIQKLIPFMILMNIINKNINIFLIMNIMNTIISTIGGLNQTFMKPLMAYSSINHMSWMIIVKLTMEKLFYLYLFIYLMTNYFIMMIFKQMNIKFISKIFYSNMSFSIKMLIFINFLSLGGIPPMIGFLLKWMTIYSIKINMILSFNIIILLMTSTITMIYYLYMFMPTIMYFNFNKKNKMFKTNFNKIFYLIYLLMFLTLSSLIFNNMI